MRRTSATTQPAIRFPAEAAELGGRGRAGGAEKPATSCEKSGSVPWVAHEAERLYGLPLEEFTGARDALARQLRADGRADEARDVAALRKPVLAAWVVNRLVREEREEVRALVSAAEEIKRGRDGADARFRTSLDRLTAAARASLEAAGRSPDELVQQVASTLRAGAATAPDVLLAGMLTRPLEASGFAAMAGVQAGRATRRGGEARPSPRVDRAKLDRARREAEDARADASRLEHEAREAERAARSARARADAARKKVEQAETRLAKARGR